LQFQSPDWDFCWEYFGWGSAGTKAHDKDHDWESLAQFGDDVFWFVPQEDPHHIKRQGQIDVSEKYRCLVMHGPHTTKIDDEKDLHSFITKFETELSKHVGKILRARHELHLEHVGGYGGGGLGFGDWSSSGWPSQAPGGGLRPYLTLAATYERDGAMGTIIMHVSLEPSYATLTIVENLK